MNSTFLDLLLLLNAVLFDAVLFDDCICVLTKRTWAERDYRARSERVIVWHCKPYVITASSRHLVASMQVPTTACSLCNTQRRARKTLWQYAASKRMHFFIHRFIYVHITLRAGIIQIYQIQEMGHKSGFVLLFPESGWYLVSINLSSCLFIFVKIAKLSGHRAKPLSR